MKFGFSAFKLPISYPKHISSLCSPGSMWGRSVSLPSHEPGTRNTPTAAQETDGIHTARAAAPRKRDQGGAGCSKKQSAVSSLLIATIPGFPHYLSFSLGSGIFIFLLESPSSDSLISCQFWHLCSWVTLTFH